MAGVLAASLSFNFESAQLISVLTAALTTAILFFISQQRLAIFVVFMLIGSAYFFWDDGRHRALMREIVYGQPVIVSGVVEKVTKGLDSQRLMVNRLQITVQRYPEYQYGDVVRLEGVVRSVPEERRGYFAKENILGLMRFPKITKIGEGGGSATRAGLFKIKEFMTGAFYQVLPPRPAAFMAGLILGDTSGFDKDFQEKLRQTGTAHLVALSGYNIAIIADATALALGYWFSRRWSFILGTLVIIGFVVMTGAEASVVRAALMVFIFLLARQIGRVYYFRNAITAAAFLMTAVNPKILVFDIGFQLSFAALLGIIYLKPWLKRKFNWQTEGFLKWRDHFLTTTAAQSAVLPLLLYHFSQWSIWGLLSNVLILAAVPTTMALGFLIAAAALIFYPLSQVVGWIAWVFLTYILGVIAVFSKNF